MSTATAVAEGEPLWKVDTCSSCFQPIIWAVTVNAKNMPVDAEPPLSGGNVALEPRGAGMPPLAKVLTVTQQFGRANLRTSHFSRCPQGDRWRRKGGRRG